MLEDAGLENFPQLWAEAIVSGSLHLDSLYATKLSDSDVYKLVNINSKTCKFLTTCTRGCIGSPPP